MMMKKPQREKGDGKPKKKRELAPERHELSLAEELDQEKDAVSSRQRPSKRGRKREEGDRYVPTGLTGKILKEAKEQQREMENEREEVRGVRAARKAFDEALGGDLDDDSDESEDEDAYDADAADRYDEEEVVEISAEDERAMAMFMSKDARPQKTLADIILEKIREKEVGIQLEMAADEDDIMMVPGLDPKVVEVYRGVGKIMERYKSGKVPKAFKIVPNLSNWEEILYLMQPEKWNPNAVYQATRLFASNLNAKMAQRFYNLVLLPRVRADINENKKLHFALYQSLKKAVYKPSAFYKGIILPLCQSQTCNLREAVIIGSVIQKVSIPVLHSSVALMKIAEMEYSGTNSYFISLLLNKKYALPYRVLDSLVKHFMQFTQEERELPVVWHQSLLCFIQRFKNELTEEDKEKLKRLMKHQKHYLVTAEVHRELMHSRHRGQSGENGTANSVNQGGIRMATIKTVPTDEDIRDFPTMEFMEEY